MEFSSEQVTSYVNAGVELIMVYGPRLLLAILFLLIGLWVIGRIVRLIGRAMAEAETDTTLAKFVSNLASIGLKAALLISVATMVGIETTSFIAVLGAAGLAVGLALQGSLSNFAGAVLVLIFKPYEVGDYIEAQGVSGTVTEIQLFSTILKTPDNKVIVVPNGAISNGVITNYSKEETRRVDFVFGIGYGDDIQQARTILTRLIDADQRVHDLPSPQIVVSELADNSVNLTVRIWVNAGDYWDVFFELTEKAKIAFDSEGISIPYPQRDVHLYQQTA